MAENRNITFNVTFKFLSGVTPFVLNLQSASYEWGKPTGNLPSQIIIPATGTSASFGACGKSGSATGTQGSIVFTASGYANFTITFNWDIPYSASNSGNILLANDSNSYYQITGDTEVPVSGNSITMNTVITQIGPK